MADQVERVILTADSTGVENASGSANRNIERLETTARRFNMTPQERIIDRFEVMRKTLGGNATALAQVDAAIARTNTQFAQMAEKASGGMSEWGSKIRNFVQNPLQAAGQAAGELATSLGPVGIGALAIGAGLAIVGKEGFGAAKFLGDYAEQLDIVSIRTGLTTKEVAAFGFAAKMGGTDIGAFEMAMRMLSKGLADNSEQGKVARGELDKLGIKYRDIEGDIKPMSGIFLEISRALNAIPDTANRNAAALAVLGRSGLELLPTILKLTSSLETFEKNKLAPSSEEIAKWDKYHEEVTLFEEQWAKLKRETLSPLAATVIVTIKYLKEIPGVGEVKKGLEAGSGLLGNLWDVSAARSVVTPEMTMGRGAPPGTQEASLEMIHRQQLRRDDLALAERMQQGALSGGDLKEQMKAAEKDAESKRKAVEEAPVGTKSQDMKELIGDWKTAESRVLAYKEAIAGIAEKEKADAAAVKEVWTQRVKLEEAYHKQRMAHNAEQLKTDNEEFLKEIQFTEKIAAARQESDTKAVTQSEARFSETFRLREDAELSSLERSKEYQLRQVEETGKSTLKEQVSVKINLEGQKAAIETDYLNRSLDKQIEILRRRTEVDILEKTKGMEAGKARELVGYSMRQEEEAKIAILRGENADKITAVEQNRAIQTNRILEAQNEKTFESLKRGFEGLFDAAFQKGKSFTDALKQMFFAIFLTPVKEAMAGLLAGLLTGRGVSGGGGAGGGLGGLLGGIFGGGGGGTGGGAGGGGLIGLLGKVPGLTFLGGGAAFSAAPSALGTTMASLPAMGTTYGGLTIPQISGMQAGMTVEQATAKTAPPAPGGIFGHSGFGTSSAGQAASGLAFSGGMMLMTDTLHRGTGGFGGAIEGAAGGAAMGFAVGGPWGAAIGGAAGALIGLFYKGAEQQVIEQVKARYRLNIERGTAAQIVQLAKQKYGGSFSAAISSPDVQDILDLVAQSTGQPFNNPNKVRPLSVTESGGKLYQNAMYENGRALSFSGSLPTYQGIPTTAVPSGPSGFNGTIIVQNQISGDHVGAFLAGKVVTTVLKAPRAIAAALNTSLAQNVGRDKLRSAIGQTGEIVA